MPNEQNPLAPSFGVPGVPWLSTQQPPAAPEPEPEPEPPPRAAATPAAVAETHRYFTELREDLLRRVSELEQFFGFVAQADDLAVRVAKLETFVFGRK